MVKKTGARTLREEKSKNTSLILLIVGVLLLFSFFAQAQPLTDDEIDELALIVSVEEEVEFDEARNLVGDAVRYNKKRISSKRSYSNVQKAVVQKAQTVCKKSNRQTACNKASNRVAKNSPRTRRNFAVTLQPNPSINLPVFRTLFQNSQPSLKVNSNLGSNPVNVPNLRGSLGNEVVCNIDLDPIVQFGSQNGVGFSQASALLTHIQMRSYEACLGVLGPAIGSPVMIPPMLGDNNNRLVSNIGFFRNDLRAEVVNNVLTCAVKCSNSRASEIQSCFNYAHTGPSTNHYTTQPASVC